MKNTLNKIKTFFSQPVFPNDEDKTRRAYLLHIILTVQTYLLLLMIAGMIVSAFVTQGQLGFEFLMSTFGLILIVLWRFLMRRGFVNIASAGMLSFFFLIVTMILYSGGTIRSTGVVFFPAVVVMATLLMNRRTGVIAFILTSIVGTALILGEINGKLPASANEVTFSSIITVVTGLGLILVLLYLASQATENALKRAVAKEQEVREFADTLEKRVAERAQALSSVAEISTAASTILETDKLLQQVVDLSKERFGFYHAHIYLLNEAGDTLVLASGAGEVGRQMVAEGRSIPLEREQSLVARAAREKKGVTVNDVTQTSYFLPNPLLPDTHSEMAVPMMVGEQVIGVFDVQSEIVGRFTEADIAVQTTLATQIAAAVQNARLYTEAETARQEGQKTAAQLSEALHIAKLSNWEYDVARDRFIFNDEFYSIFRTTAEREGGYELSSAEYAERLVHPDDLPMVGAEIEKALTSIDRHYSTRLEHRILYRDGSGTGYIAVEVHIDRDDQGRILRYYGANQDITERKLLQNQLEQRAKQQEAINLITQRIQSTQTIESALQVAVRELGRAFGHKPTVVSLEPIILAGESKTVVNE